MLGGCLAAAGEHLTAQAVSSGSASAECFGADFFLLIRSVKRRGGLLDAEPTPAERVTYNLEPPYTVAPRKARGIS